MKQYKERSTNNTKNAVQTIQITVNTSKHITKTPTPYKTHIRTPMLLQNKLKIL